MIGFAERFMQKGVELGEQQGIRLGDAHPARAPGECRWINQLSIPIRLQAALRAKDLSSIIDINRVCVYLSDPGVPKTSHPISQPSYRALALFGTLLRAARIERGMSQAQLAGRLGVSRHSVMALEQGSPTLAIGTAFEAAVILGIPLLADDEQGLAKLAGSLAALATVLPVRAGRKTAALDDDF